MNPSSTPSVRLLRRVRWWTAFFMIGLFLSGATAIPLLTEVGWLVEATGARQRMDAPGLAAAPAWSVWLCRVQDGLTETNARFPFIAYGGDWLAFGHFALALVFVGAWRDPVRNRWLYDFGLMACALVIPYAMIFGELRGIPIWWRWIDCSFGVMGAVPLWLCRRWVLQLEAGAPAGVRTVG